MASKTDFTLFVASASVAAGFTFCPLKILGLFFLHMQRDLDATAKEVSLGIGLISALTFLCGPLAALVYNRVGSRYSLLLAASFTSFGLSVSSMISSIEGITVLYAIFLGFGIGMMNLSIYSMSGRIFSCRLSLANNIINSSYSIVTIAFAPVTQLLIESFGWRGTLLLLGGIIFNAFPASMLAADYYSQVASAKTKNTSRFDSDDANHLTNDRSRSEKNVDGQSEHAQKSLRATFIAAKALLRNRFFVVFIISMTFGNVARLSVLLYTVRYAQSAGISDETAAWILTLQELLSVVSGPPAGYLTSTKLKNKEINEEKKDGSAFPRWLKRTSQRLRHIPRSCAHVFLSAIFSVSILIPVASPTYLGFVMSGILNGFIMGANTALPVTVLTDFFRKDDIVAAQGIRSLLAGIGFIVYPWIVGTVIDATGSYIGAQVAAASCSLTSAILAAITHMGMKRRTRSQKMVPVVQRNIVPKREEKEAQLLQAQCTGKKAQCLSENP